MAAAPALIGSVRIATGSVLWLFRCRLTAAVESLINQSEASLASHLNGDIAEWERPAFAGGRYEGWLVLFCDALDVRSVGKRPRRLVMVKDSRRIVGRSSGA